MGRAKAWLLCRFKGGRTLAETDWRPLNRSSLDRASYGGDLAYARGAGAGPAR